MSQDAKQLYDDGLELLRKKDVHLIPEAVRKLRAAREGYRALEDQTGEGWCLVNLALSASAGGDRSATEAHLAELNSWLDLQELPVSALPSGVKPTKDETLLCMARIELARFYRVQGRPERAAQYFSRAVPYFEERREAISLANVCREMAVTYHDLRDFQGAVDIMHRALDAVADQDDPALLLDVHFMLGYSYYLNGDLPSAIVYQERALRYAQQAGNDEAAYQLTSNLAGFTFDQAQYARAVPHLGRLIAYQEAQGDIVGKVQSQLRLASSYGELGTVQKAIFAYKQASSSLEALNRVDGLEYGMCKLGLAQSLVDAKKFGEAREHLIEAEKILQPAGQGVDLVHDLRQRIDEGENPLCIDCAHRIISMSLPSATASLSRIQHKHPQPIVYPGEAYITSELSEEDRTRFDALTDELGADWLRTQFAPARRDDVPDSFQMGLKLEYVDDLEEFEIKWTAYKDEHRKQNVLRALQGRWEREKDSVSVTEGMPVSDIQQLLAYITEITIQVKGYADIRDRENTRAFALYAADFLETRTNDPFIAVYLWRLRATLLRAVYALVRPSARGQLEQEIIYSMQMTHQLVETLDGGRKAKAMGWALGEWWDVGNAFMGEPAFKQVKEYAEAIASLLGTRDRVIYGLALSRLERYDEAVVVLQPLMAQVRGAQEFRMRQLAHEAQVALARSRVLMQCPDPEDCAQFLGPFAPYIYAEIVHGRINEYWWLGQPDCGDKPPNLRGLGRAFIDGSLIVIEQSAGPESLWAVQMHETQHALRRRAGQQFRTESGEWLQVKRDVPIASAETFTLVLQEAEDPRQLTFSEFFDIGRRCVVNRSDQAHRFVQNMLQYFDDLDPQETRASYPCAAILVGIALGLLGERNYEGVRSYISHLSVMDHSQALVMGRNRAVLGL